MLVISSDAQFPAQERIVAAMRGLALDRRFGRTLAWWSTGSMTRGAARHPSPCAPALAKR
jgi:hypothetical protein